MANHDLRGYPLLAAFRVVNATREIRKRAPNGYGKQRYYQICVEALPEVKHAMH